MELLEAIRMNERICCPTKGSIASSEHLFYSAMQQVSSMTISSTQDNNPHNDTTQPKTVRELAHDLSNALEIIMQSSFLLGTLDLGENGRQWHQLLDDGIQRATAINRQLRDALRVETGENHSGSR
jgi:hypothetical protein